MRENVAAVLAEAARRSMTTLTHLRAEQMHDAVAQAMGGPRPLWQSRTAPRDIAPLRNMSLLVSIVVNAHTTVLVDDDICGFDLDATHRMLDAVNRGAGGLVAGAEIDGITEQDTVTRLSAAMRLLESRTHHFAVPAEELFRVLPGCGNGRTDECWVSAGYMAFRLPATGLFAFPPGYNEDWLWCLLHDTWGDTRVLRIDQAVVHKPPLLRQPTRDDILFELAGDLILDCLSERSARKPHRPDSALEDLANHSPHPSVMPSARAKAVLEQARHLSENGHVPALAELESHGLTVLNDMLSSGELEMDGNTMLSAWSVDAIAKHKSFAAALGNTTARATLETMFQEGTL
jgi:hypothetical protein